MTHVPDEPKNSAVSQGPAETPWERIRRMPNVLRAYAADIDKYGKPLDSGLPPALRFTAQFIHDYLHEGDKAEPEQIHPDLLLGAPASGEGDAQWERALNCACSQFESYVLQDELKTAEQRKRALDDALQHAVGLLKFWVSRQSPSLAEEVGRLRHAAQIAREALTHLVPEDCWATGPNTGNPIEDLVVCSGCRANHFIDQSLSTSPPPTQERLPPHELESARIFGDTIEHWKIRVGALCRERDELRQRLDELEDADTQERDEAWGIINTLRAEEGAFVTIYCDNPDFNGQPNSKISVCASWTNWEEMMFGGDSVIEALRSAKSRMEATQ